MFGGRTVDGLLRVAWRAGEPADLRALAAEHGVVPEVRAETLLELLTEDRGDRRAVPRAELTGAKVLGTLRLTGAVLDTPLWCTDCEFDNPPDLRMAQLAGLALRGCRLPGLLASNLRVAAGLDLTGLRSTGGVALNDAQIGGTLRLDRAELHESRGYALFAERLEVRGALYARWMRAHGELRVPGAKVVGNINLSGARLSNPGLITLDANGIDVSGSLVADRRIARGAVDGDPQRFISEGRVLLAGARIGGDLVLSGALIRRELPTPTVRTGHWDGEQSMRLVPRGIVDAAACLVADRIRVEGNLELDDGFRAHGTVRLPNALVGGYLRMSGAQLGRAADVPAGEPASSSVALLGDGMDIGGDLEGRDGGAGALRVSGQLRLAGARVRGSASLSGITLDAPGADALYADALTVGSMLFLRNVRAAGTVRLQGARIGAALDLAGSQLTRPRIRSDGSVKPSLDLRAATLGKDLFCNDGFRADGGIRLASAEVGKSVVVVSAVLGEQTLLTGPGGGSAGGSGAGPEPGSEAGCGVGADSGPVSGRGARTADGGRGPSRLLAFDADGLVVPELILTPGTPPLGQVRLTKARVRSWTDDASLWSAGGGLELAGFEYQALGADLPVADRLRWMERSFGVRQYLPGPYEQLAAAYRADGREEEVERVQMARQRRRYSCLGVAGRGWGELQRWTVGFGYRPWLAVAWLTLFWVLGAVWFTGHPLSRVDTGQNPVWNPWLYSADTLLPIVNLGAKGYWRAAGASQWITSCLVAVGWILASTAARGAARILKRN